ncbi:MAG: MFS transporter, partial [Deltaproteobacteria bacterium]
MSNNHERADKTPRLFYGWIVVGVSFVTLAFGFGVWYSFSVFFLAVIKDFGWSRAAASSIFSVFVITQATMGLLAGYLQDRFGPRIVIPFGTLILALALALTSRAQSLWYFYVCYGVFAGASMSLLGFGSHSAFLPQWFERKRGLATGIAMSGIGFGMLLIVP